MTAVTAYEGCRKVFITEEAAEEERGRLTHLELHEHRKREGGGRGGGLPCSHATAADTPINFRIFQLALSNLIGYPVVGMPAISLERVL